MTFSPSLAELLRHIRMTSFSTRSRSTDITKIPKRDYMAGAVKLLRIVNQYSAVPGGHMKMLNRSFKFNYYLKISHDATLRHRLDRKEYHRQTGSRWLVRNFKKPPYVRRPLCFAKRMSYARPYIRRVVAAQDQIFTRTGLEPCKRLASSRTLDIDLPVFGSRPR